MKRIALALAFAAIPALGTASKPAEPPKIADLIMPASEHPEVAAVEVVIEIDDTEKAEGLAALAAGPLGKRGVRGVANVTYLWGDPDGWVLIDANIYRFESAALARQHLEFSAARQKPENVTEIEGVGDHAIRIQDSSLTHFDAIKFVHGTTFVSLETILEEIDVPSVADAYSAWLTTSAAAK